MKNKVYEKSFEYRVQSEEQKRLLMLFKILAEIDSNKRSTVKNRKRIIHA